MDDDSLPGAFSGPPPRPISPATFDQAHGATAHSELIWRLAAQAYGEDYPAEVQPWGMTTLWVLGRCVSGLRVGPGHQLVDLACGRGGPGLWLARATGADLIGIDWSPVGVEAASARASHFVQADRARFMVGDLAASGLPEPRMRFCVWTRSSSPPTGSKRSAKCIGCSDRRAATSSPPPR